MLQTAAQKYREAGLNILPTSKQTKRPMFNKWRGYVSKKCETPIKENWASALAIVCGEISGRVEVVDFDFQAEDFENWKAELLKIDPAYEAFLDVLLIETTQSGGRHVAYRVEGDAPLKTQKLTYRELFPAEGEIKTKKNGDRQTSFVSYKNKEITKSADGRFIYGTIETRAEGAIAIIAPTPGYEVIQGSWEELPVIPFEFREAMFQAALNLTCVKFKPTLKTAPADWYDSAKLNFGDQVDVAQYLRESDAARKLLLQHGWTLAVDGYDGDNSLWRRPGKERGVSATLDNKTGKFWIYTTNGAISPLQAQRAYTPLQLYAEYNFGGDEREAAIDVLRTLEKDELQQYESLDLSYLFNCKPNAEKEETPAPKVDIIEEVEEPSNDITDKYKTIYDIKLPECCINPGGWLERVMDYTDSVSKRRQRSLAFASAATTLGHIAARRVGFGAAQTMLSPALFTLAISPPSSGKGSGLHVAQQVANIICPKAEISNGYESVQKFYETLEATSKQYLVMDEFGAFLSSINAERSNSVKSRLITAWVDIFTAYNKFDLTAPSSLRKGDSPPIYRPSFSLYGVTNFTEFQTAFCGVLLKNGFQARFLFVVGDPNAAMPYVDDADDEDGEDGETLPLKIIEETKAWKDINPNSDNPACQSKPFRVRASREVDAEIREYVTPLEKELPGLPEGARRYLWGRATEKTKKYALLFACSKFGAKQDSLKIDKECARQAIALNQYELEMFDYLDATVLADSAEEKNVLEVEKWLRSLDGDVISLASFTNRFRKIRRQEREQVLLTLQEKGRLELFYDETTVGSDGKNKLRKKYFKVVKR